MVLRLLNLVVRVWVVVGLIWWMDSVISICYSGVVLVLLRLISSCLLLVDSLFVLVWNRLVCSKFCLVSVNSLFLLVIIFVCKSVIFVL